MSIKDLSPELVEASRQILEQKKYEKASKSKYDHESYAGKIALANDKLKGDKEILKALNSELKKDGKSSTAIKNLMNDNDFVSDTVSAYNRLIK